MGVGRPRNIESPELMLELWEQYKAHVDANPDVIQEVTVKGVMEREVRRPYLRQGFEAFCFRNGYGNIYQYFDNVGDRYKEYLGVITHIRAEYQNDQIGGTMTGMFKAPNLTARLNGLVDKKEEKNEGKMEVVVTYESKDNTQRTAHQPGKDDAGKEEV